MTSPSARAVAGVLGGVVLLVGGLLTLLWLVVDSGTAQAPAQLELVRIALTVLLGTGGLFGLWLAWRRQRSTEIALQQKERDQADVARAYDLQRETAEATQRDADARRITDLYTKAVEQLGSDKAPVRLGGLYALERLAQEHPGNRQTVVNVYCAYLRMPYTLPGSPPADDAEDRLSDAHRERVQEREVRLATQRILAAHLRMGDQEGGSWPLIDLDLTGATLIDFDLGDCAVREARFTRATFVGDTTFRRVRFSGEATFDGATFAGKAAFRLAGFAGDAGFREVVFRGEAGFVEATFAGNAGFLATDFTGAARFMKAAFAGNASFSEAVFHDNVEFKQATVTGDAWFRKTTFAGSAVFRRATFTGDAQFDSAVLPATRLVDDATPAPWTDFTGARFARRTPEELARFTSPSA
ncbi:pentapeptide repeat-containing protein [Actinokineospora sp. 24-640]